MINNTMFTLVKQLDIASRTRQHIEADPLVRTDWQAFAEDSKSRMFVIGNEYFNKSLTLI